MGMFRTLYVRLPCSRCSKARIAEVQFKTGKDDLEEYSEGDIIEPSHWIDASKEHDGLSDDSLFCDACFYQWRKALISAEYELLMQFMLEGRVKLLLKTGEPVTADLLLSLGNDAVSEIDEDRADTVYLRHAADPPPIHCFGSVPYKFDLGFDGLNIDLVKNTNPDFDFVELFQDQTDLTMKERGWNDGSDWMSKSLVVYLDKDRRIRCRVRH